MSEKKYDCIIIGGGISGISFAHYLHIAGKNVLILEKESKVGGQVQSIFSQTNAHYWRELGAHTCYNSYTHLLSILKDINGTEAIQSLGKGSYVLYSGGKIKKMFSEVSIIPMMFNGLRMFSLAKTGKTVKEYFSKIVGIGNYNRLFSRLFRAVICQNADNYPAELFLKHRRDRYKEFPRKYSFKEGISSFLDTIIEKDSLKVKVSSEVIDIQENLSSGYDVITSDNKVYHASNVAFAANPDTTATLLREIEPSLYLLLASIPSFYSESLNVMVSKDKLDIDNVAGIIPVSDDFMSAVSRDLIEDENLRSFTFHFEKGKKSEKEKLDIVCNVLNITENDIIESKIIQHTLPALGIQHLDMAGQIEKGRVRDGIYVLGNYFYGLSLEDCIHRSKDEFDRFLMKNMS
ncbi:MAG: FAD-dependent oxidoreductase [Dysgonomonas sp.]|nr:FAD-dependent oxidoreductase [Dysgonomonas sp.]